MEQRIVLTVLYKTVYIINSIQDLERSAAIELLG